MQDILRQKRELRLKIGRTRRRIDARLRSARDEGRKLVSWRTYVVRYPGCAVAAAFGAGLGGATLFGRRGAIAGRLLQGLGRGIFRSAADRAVQAATAELRRYWATRGERA